MNSICLRSVAFAAAVAFSGTATAGVIKSLAQGAALGAGAAIASHAVKKSLDKKEQRESAPAASAQAVAGTPRQPEPQVQAPAPASAGQLPPRVETTR